MPPYAVVCYLALLSTSAVDLAAAILVYTGLLFACLAAISVVKPLRFWPFETRKRSCLVFAGALIGIVVCLVLPANEERVHAPNTLLDVFMPVYQFHEVHDVEVHATRDQVYAAIRSVTPGEIALYQALTWIRRFGRDSRPNILNAPETLPLLETAIQGGFMVLAEEPGDEIVIGVVLGGARADWYRDRPSPDKFKALRAVKAAMNFRLIRRSDGIYRVVTETRVTASSARGRRAFGAYWRLIYPGSAIIRRMWLRAIQRRAETARLNG